MRHQGCFITGTDTDVGKTVVTAILYRAGLRSNRKIAVIKPVQTGAEHGIAPDVETYRRIVADLEVEKTLVALECFSVPCSPHLAASIEGRTVGLEKLVRRIREFQEQYDFVIVEGAGGLWVPINERETMLDLIAAANFPVLLVFENRVGCINQAMLSLRELQRRRLPILGCVSNCVRKTDPSEKTVRTDNIETILRLSAVPVLVDLPFLNLDAGDSAGQIESWDRVAREFQIVWDLLDEGRKERKPETDDLLEFDRKHLWHPYTSAVDPHPVVPIAGAKGCSLYTEDGRELIDGMSSWWCAIHGYNHPILNEAVRRQLDRTAHVMFGGITHRGAVDLARKILSLAPGTMDRVFFADSGSVSVEVALKMALQFQQARGETSKTRFMTFRGGYHGDTFGAMSVCDPVHGMHSLFQGMLSKQIFADRPDFSFDGNSDSEEFETKIQAIERLFEEHAGETAAFILEPVVQGAGGMRFYHPDYLKRIRRFCDRYDVLLIADEIATGFGRTGKMFAVQWAGIEPDLMCLGKALSGGYMTLAATLANRKVAEGISSGGNVFMHGPTFMANPLACAAANASLDLFMSEHWRDNVRRIETRLANGLEPCHGRDGVADVRILGAIGVVETNQPVNTRRLQEFFVDRGVWLRPFGRLIYLMPPYCITDEQIERLTDSVCRSVEEGQFLP